MAVTPGKKGLVDAELAARWEGVLDVTPGKKGLTATELAAKWEGVLEVVAGKKGFTAAELAAIWEGVFRDEAIAESSTGGCQTCGVSPVVVVISMGAYFRWSRTRRPGVIGLHPASSPPAPNAPAPCSRTLRVLSIKELLRACSPRRDRIGLSKCKLPVLLLLVPLLPLLPATSPEAVETEIVFFEASAPLARGGSVLLVVFSVLLFVVLEGGSMSVMQVTWSFPTWRLYLQLRGLHGRQFKNNLWRCEGEKRG